MSNGVLAKNPGSPPLNYGQTKLIYPALSCHSYLQSGFTCQILNVNHTRPNSEVWDLPPSLGHFLNLDRFYFRLFSVQIQETMSKIYRAATKKYQFVLLFCFNAAKLKIKTYTNMDCETALWARKGWFRTIGFGRLSVSSGRYRAARSAKKLDKGPSLDSSWTPFTPMTAHLPALTGWQDADWVFATSSGQTRRLPAWSQISNNYQRLLSP